MVHYHTCDRKVLDIFARAISDIHMNVDWFPMVVRLQWEDSSTDLFYSQPISTPGVYDWRMSCQVRGDSECRLTHPFVQLDLHVQGFLRHAKLTGGLPNRGRCRPLGGVLDLPNSQTHWAPVRYGDVPWVLDIFLTSPTVPILYIRLNHTLYCHRTKHSTKFSSWHQGHL